MRVEKDWSRIEQLFHGCSVPGPKIQSVACTLVEKMLDGSCMGVRKIENVDEVAHAGAVACVIVGTEDLKIRATAQSRIQRDGYGVSFGRMPFPDSALGIGTGGVEIAQDERAKALMAIEIPQDLLDNQFGLAISIRRPQRRILANRR